MDQTLLVVMTVFVIVAALALLMQVAILIGVYKKLDVLKQDGQRVLSKAEALMDTSRAAIEESRKLIGEVTAKAVEILDSARAQLARVDEVLTDASARAHVQFDHIETVLDDTINRAHETVVTVHGGIMKPLREIQGVVTGVRVALNFLMRGGRPDPAHVHTDEEMFI